MLDLHRMDIEMMEARQRLLTECPKCSGEGGHVPDDDDLDEDTLEPKIEPCVCRAELVQAISLIDGNVPREFRSDAQETFKAFAQGPNSHVAKLAIKYVRRFKAVRKHGLGFLFYGENGTGKTLTASWLLSRAVRKGLSVFYATAEEWLAATRDAFKDDEFAEWLATKRDVDLFVLDELGKEHRAKGSTYATSEIDRIIRSRAASLLPTIVVTNLLDLDELKPVLGTSLYSILSGRRYSQVEFEAGDFRKAVSWEDLIDDGE